MYISPEEIDGLERGKIRERILALITDRPSGVIDLKEALTEERFGKAVTAFQTKVREEIRYMIDDGVIAIDINFKLMKTAGK